MALHTEKLVACSPFAGRIKVIPSKIEEVKLPEQVDMIISEPMGYMLYNERMLETYIHARKVTYTYALHPTPTPTHLFLVSKAKGPNVSVNWRFARCSIH